jgi:hypothetical protein
MEHDGGMSFASAEAKLEALMGGGATGPKRRAHSLPGFFRSSHALGLLLLGLPGLYSPGLLLLGGSHLLREVSLGLYLLGLPVLWLLLLGPYFLWLYARHRGHTPTPTPTPTKVNPARTPNQVDEQPARHRGQDGRPRAPRRFGCRGRGA